MCITGSTVTVGESQTGRSIHICRADCSLDINWKKLQQYDIQVVMTIMERVDRRHAIGSATKLLFCILCASSSTGLRLQMITPSTSCSGLQQPCTRSHRGRWTRGNANTQSRISIVTMKHANRDSALYASLLPSSLPLIARDDAWGNWAVLSTTAATAQLLGRTTALGKLLGPPVTAMAMTFFLATFGVLAPGGTPSAKALQLLSLQLATPLILLGADLRDAGKRCGPLLISFMIASIATLIASTVGWMVAGPMLSRALGRDGLILAAALMAKNVGGGINYVAVCRSLNASPTAVAAGLCIDNIFALVYFPGTSVLSSRYADVNTRATPSEAVVDGDDDSTYPETKDETITVQSVSNVLCISAALLWLGERIGGATGALPVCTLLTVALASWAPRHRLQLLQPAAQSLGLVSLYLFFSTAGAPGVAVAESVRASLLPLGLFLMLLYSIHAAILAAVYRIMERLPKQRFGAFAAPQRLLVASSAAIGGPATAVALAQAAGWKSLEVPSLLVGNIGYAIATFVALAYYSMFLP